jgi:hypothetical protein
MEIGLNLAEVLQALIFSAGLIAFMWFFFRG